MLPGRAYAVHTAGGVQLVKRSDAQWMRRPEAATAHHPQGFAASRDVVPAPWRPMTTDVLALSFSLPSPSMFRSAPSNLAVVTASVSRLTDAVTWRSPVSMSP